MTTISFLKLATLGLLATSLVGGLAVSESYWWLGALLFRPFIAALNLRLPRAWEKRHSEGMAGLLGLTLAVTFTGWNESDLMQVWLVALYLSLDTDLDRRALSGRSENTWPFALTVLVFARTFGGLLGAMFWALEIEVALGGNVSFLQLQLGCIMLVLLCSSQPAPPVPDLPRTFVGQPLYSRTAFKGLSLVTLLAVCVGIFGVAESPVAILRPEFLSLGAQNPWLLLQVATLSLLLSKLLSWSVHKHGLPLAGALYLSSLALQVAPLATQIQAMLTLTSAVLALVFVSTWVLQRVESAPTGLEVSILMTLWGFGAALGFLTSGFESSNTDRLIALFCGLLLLALGYREHKHHPLERIQSLSEQRDADKSRAISERPHGDLRQDFVNVPMPGRKKKTWLRFSSLWLFLSVKLPVILILSAGVAVLVGGFWHLSGQRQDWKARTTDAWKVLQTQLYFSSIARRLEEDMLASSRVPDDWERFLESSFQMPSPYQPGHDPWGQPILLETQGSHLNIISAGPDQSFGTPRDLVRSVKIPAGVKH